MNIINIEYIYMNINIYVRNNYNVEFQYTIADCYNVTID